MARLLYDRQSSGVHLNIAQRHVRLCRQVSGTETLVAGIQPTIVALEAKQNVALNKAVDRDAAYDNLIFRDSKLDDCVRTIFDNAKQYDRENPGRPVLLQLFPDGKFSTITTASLEKEADLAEKLLIRLQALGESHALHSRVSVLQQAIANCRTAQTAFHSAITMQKSAEAEEEIAQAALRKQYEFNFYEASRLFGRPTADRLFPQAASGVLPAVLVPEADENTPPPPPSLP